MDNFLTSGVHWILLSSVLWAIAAQIFSWGGAKVGVLRLNLYKSWITWPCFIALTVINGESMPNMEVTSYLLVSGFLGYTIGDFFIFLSFVKLGPSRTLVLHSFSPVILAVLSFFLLDLAMPAKKLIALALLLLAIILYLKERAVPGQNYHISHLFLGLLGISLDSLGLILSKKAFMLDHELSSNMANSVRLISAIFAFSLIRVFFKHKFQDKISWHDKKIIALASFIGTFLALYFYLRGLSTLHPALVAALAGMAPIYSTFFEYYKKKTFPSRYMFLTLLCMLSSLAVLYF